MRLLNVSKRPVSLVAFCAAIALSLSACGGEAEKAPMSESQLGWDSGQSQVESPDDVVAMSGIYEVTREGKLLRYSSDPRLDKPELSDVAKVHDNNGAEAFARYFVKVVEYTWDSGDSALLREVSKPECQWCDFLARKTDERAENGGWVRNVRVTVKEVEPAFEVPDDPGLWHVTMHAHTKAHTSYDGEKLKEIEEENSVLHLGLRFIDNRWVVEGAAGEAEAE